MQVSGVVSVRWRRSLHVWAAHLILHLPAGWPWVAWFALALPGCAASPTPP